MKANVFERLQNVNWARFWIFISTVLTFWTCISVLVPDTYHKIIDISLGAVSTTVAYFVRATKYVQDRGTVPPQGERP